MIQRLICILTFGILGSACHREDSSFRDIARRQAAGLEGSSVIIHSVTEHASFHRATPNENQKLVVVDVTFKDHKTGFGLAGVELIDGEEKVAKSYGGDPYQVYLEEDGTLMKDQSGEHLVGPINWHYEKPIRVYLVYSAPLNVKKVGLGYWSNVIVDRPYDIEKSK